MNFSKEIILACEVGIKVLDIIKDYTKRMGATESDFMYEMYENNRIGVLPHLQTQLLSITAMLNGREPIPSEEFKDLDGFASKRTL